MSKDIKTLGLSIESREIIDDMMESGYFEDKQHAAKFALSIAIKEKVPPGETQGTETVWNIGSFDTKGELRGLVLTLYDNIEAPYKSIEHFINRGLEIIGEETREAGTFDLLDLIEKYN